jgi:hypothetical protein
LFCSYTCDAPYCSTNNDDKKRIEDECKAVEKLPDQQMFSVTNKIQWRLIGMKVDTLRSYRLFPAESFSPARTAIDCQLQWENNVTPLLEWGALSASEETQLTERVAQHDSHDWRAIVYGTRRAPWLALRLMTQRRQTPDARWSAAEDARLTRAVTCVGTHWQRVAQLVGGHRTATQCLHRWSGSASARIRRTAFSREEDTRLKVAVDHYGTGQWTSVAGHIPGTKNADDNDVMFQICVKVEMQLNVEKDM